MGSIFWVLVKVIPGFVQVSLGEGSKNWYWLVARPAFFVNSSKNGFEILFEVLVNGQTGL